MYTVCTCTHNVATNYCTYAHLEPYATYVYYIGLISSQVSSSYTVVFVIIRHWEAKFLQQRLFELATYMAR